MRPRGHRTAIWLLVGAGALLSVAAAAQGRIEITGTEDLLGKDARARAITQSRLHDLECTAAPWAVRFRAGRLGDASSKGSGIYRDWAPPARLRLIGPAIAGA